METITLSQLINKLQEIQQEVEAKFGQTRWRDPPVLIDLRVLDLDDFELAQCIDANLATKEHVGVAVLITAIENSRCSSRQRLSLRLATSS
jgi:hypothetical protein